MSLEPIWFLFEFGSNIQLPPHVLSSLGNVFYVKLGFVNHRFRLGVIHKHHFLLDRRCSVVYFFPSLENVMFKSHRNRGFQMVFANGYTVSVQFGENNYCSRRDENEEYGAWRSASMEHSSPDAEVAIWKEHGSFVDLEKNTSDVFSYQTPDQVAKIISIVSSW